MSIQTGISSCSSEVLPISVRNVNSVGIDETLRQAEINDEYQVFSCFLITNEEIVRLDISVYYAILMHHLDSLHHLQPQVYAGAQVKLPPALREQVFQTLAQKVHDHHVEHSPIFGFLISHEM